MDLTPKFKGTKILLVDDDQWIRDSLTLFFEGEGSTCTAVESAEEGLTAIRERDYDILLVDYRLPGIDGLEFLKRIAKSYPDAIKILITAYGNEDVYRKARNMGVGDIIEKPLTSELIESSLLRLIDTGSKSPEYRCP